MGTVAAHRVPIADVTIYDTDRRVWGGSRPLPEPRCGHSLVNVGQYIVLFGGVNPLLRERRGDVMIMDMETMEWTSLRTHGITLNFKPAPLQRELVLISTPNLRRSATFQKRTQRRSLTWQ